MLRRYEILLPLRSNEGVAFPDELFARTLSEIEEQFGSVSSESQVIRGIWHREGQTYRDQLIRIFADVEDDDESRLFFRALKETIKERFRQLDIWMTSHPIDVV